MRSLQHLLLDNKKVAGTHKGQHRDRGADGALEAGRETAGAPERAARSPQVCESVQGRTGKVAVHQGDSGPEQGLPSPAGESNGEEVHVTSTYLPADYFKVMKGEVLTTQTRRQLTLNQGSLGTSATDGPDDRCPLRCGWLSDRVGFSLDAPSEHNS